MGEVWGLKHCPLCGDGLDVQDDGDYPLSKHILASCPNRELFRRLSIGEARKRLKQRSEKPEVTLKT